MWAAWTEHKVFANRRQDLIAVIDKALKNNVVICCGARMSGLGGGFNRSAQHSNLVAKMECGHEAATAHLLFCGSAVCDLGSLAGWRVDEFNRTSV
jgi:hypothetical protein